MSNGDQSVATGRTATMRDVARHAGVSHMTVSRVINGDRAVRPQTRELVEKAIRDLRFSPNEAARALSNAVPARIALLHRFPNAGSLGNYLVHLLQAATRAHASMVLHEVPEGGQADTIAELRQDGIRGVILAPPMGNDRTLIAGLRQEGLAVIATGSIHAESGLASVGIDDRAAARAMTAHLLGLGHRRIGIITGRPNHASSQCRLDGYRDALAAAGIAVDPHRIAQGLYTYQSGLAAAEALLSLAEPPTAIFASNDDMAAAAMAVAHRMGLDVPADLSVCGFDDTPLASTIWPALTTIRQPNEALTQRAFDMIMQRVGGGVADEGERVELDHLLVRRQSDGPPAP
ncbi:LacI family DNA-binding transcriptional regulator [Sphingomonas sp. BGYR3]|uniref:LacI family DNA-binding transcriptional regulator n=1 Tax=Sphingomonas sp. BGYR3 TaxID=2975483 RepID=UPI0021A8BD80|nr:LacI family DNA-binding transcriptional regulator [Sphingomonas sp. BGYR3]MDG5487952.1 LacI family DNA-binding transcriptional regulator [Sphingomonas sp. BGYR3]